jgi:hypothetical protein
MKALVVFVLLVEFSWNYVAAAEDAPLPGGWFMEARPSAT